MSLLLLMLHRQLFFVGLCDTNLVNCYNYSKLLNDNNFVISIG